jgi:hypothetical protein
MFERTSDGKPVLRVHPLQANVLPNGEGTLYKKIHGLKANVAAGATHTFSFSIPYDDCFFTGAEIVHDVKDVCDFTVDHPQAGLLEQYGFDVNIGVIEYVREGGYGAHLFKDLILKCVVTNNDSVAKDIGVNFLLDEIRTT